MKIEKVRVKLIRWDDVDNMQGGVRHIKTLPYFSVVQSLTGSYGISLDGGEERHTGEGGIFLAPANVLQRIDHQANGRESMHCRWIFLEVMLNDHYPMDLVREFPTVAEGEAKIRMQGLMDEFFAAEDDCDRMSVLYRLTKELLALSREGISDPEMVQVAAYIRKNARLPLRVEDLAAIRHCSVSHFHALFRRVMHTSPAEYLMRCRLSMAAEMLEQSTESAAEIARRVGIPDYAHFSKLFKKKYGITPRAYRASRG